MRIAYESAAGTSGKSVEVDGITNLLNYPEFKNVEKVKNLLSLFESGDNSITDIIPANISEDSDNKLKVYIGDENGDPHLPDASIVFCSMNVGKKNTIFGILGPRRMDYKKAATALSSLAKTIEDMSSGKHDNENYKNLIE